MIILIFSCSNVLLRQDLIVQQGSRYHYRSGKYKYPDLKYVLIQSDQAYSHFIEYNRLNKLSNMYGVIGAGMMGTGVFILVTAQSDRCGIGLLCDEKIIRPSAGLLAVIPFTIGAIYKGKARKYMKSSLSIFNEDVLQNKISLQLSMKGNGVGLVLNF